jgi:hypothetical protein
VAEDAVLCDVKADRDRRWIAAADREVDVGHARIERALVGVGDPLVRRDAAGRRKRHAAAPAGSGADRAATGEHHHHPHALLKPGRLIAEDEYRPGGAIANEPDGAPQVNRTGQPIAAGRDEHQTAAEGTAGFVDRRLDRGGVIRGGVPADREFRRREMDSARVIGPGREHRLRRRPRAGDQEHDCQPCEPA